VLTARVSATEYAPLLMTVECPLTRPALRGWIHFASALAAPFALAYLLIVANSPRGYISGAIFGGGLLLLFATSASYHLPPWSPRARKIIGRIDHSMIFIAIAASYTPFCLQVADSTWGIAILVVVWSLASAGVVMKMAWPSAPKWLSVTCYLGVGWVAITSFGPLSQSLPATGIGLVVAAGLMYTVGAIVYAARWPNPIPRFVGHHEVFHLMVTVASMMMYGVVATYVVSA
jgi:hemolysin III